MTLHSCSAVSRQPMAESRYPFPWQQRGKDNGHRLTAFGQRPSNEND
jgi:hypothetical protein